MYESPAPVNPETVGAMLPKLGDLLMLLNVSSDEKILPTTYGELRPPLGKHRLKIVEFIAVLLKTGNEVAEKELVTSGTIQRVLDLFFEYPFHNSLHHHVESIIISCLESKNDTIVNHLLRECDLIGKILQTDKHPAVCSDQYQPTLPAAGRQTPRAGNLGHITRISNKLVQLSNSNIHIQTFLQDNTEWNEWQTTVLQDRNMVENVYRWACGRPTALHDRTRDSDEEDLHDRDYDVAALANNLSQAFRYSIYDNEDTEEGNRAIDRDDEDVYFDDESAEVVISSLRLGDDHGSLFTNSNWFAFQDDRIGDAPMSTSATEAMDEINLNGTSTNGNSSSDDEVVVGEDEELTDSKTPANSTSSPDTKNLNGFAVNNSTNVDSSVPQNENPSASGDMGFFRFETPDEDLFGDRPLPEWVGWGDPSDFQVGGSSVNPFEDPAISSINLADPADEGEAANVSSPSSGEVVPNGTSTPTDSSDGPLVGSDSGQRAVAVPSLFEEDVEFVGVEIEGTEKAMDQALKEGIVGEAGPLKRNIIPKVQGKENEDESGSGMKEFNDANYWRVDQEVAVTE
jgi:serine/threonine-protein phosphatase 6 regulatory subunit 3